MREGLLCCKLLINCGAIDVRESTRRGQSRSGSSPRQVRAGAVFASSTNSRTKGLRGLGRRGLCRQGYAAKSSRAGAKRVGGRIDESRPRAAVDWDVRFWRRKSVNNVESDVWRNRASGRAGGGVRTMRSGGWPPNVSGRLNRLAPNQLMRGQETPARPNEPAQAC